jgi:hypothetical protein
MLGPVVATCVVALAGFAVAGAGAPSGTGVVDVLAARCRKPNTAGPISSHGE